MQLTIKKETSAFTLLEMLFIIIILTILSATIFPYLLSTKLSAQEAQAMGDSRTIYTAEVAYSIANGGYYSDIINLCRDGDDCAGIGIPNYPASEPEFLSGLLGLASPYYKGGFSRNWVGGNAPTTILSTQDPNSVLSFCYNSFPESMDARAFSINELGLLYYNPNGIEIICPIPSSTRVVGK